MLTYIRNPWLLLNVLCKVASMRRRKSHQSWKHRSFHEAIPRIRSLAEHFSFSLASWSEFAPHTLFRKYVHADHVLCDKSVRIHYAIFEECNRSRVLPREERRHILRTIRSAWRLWLSPRSANLSHVLRFFCPTCWISMTMFRRTTVLRIQYNCGREWARVEVLWRYCNGIIKHGKGDVFRAPGNS